MPKVKWNAESDGTFSETALIMKLEKLGYRCTHYTYPAGTEFPPHEHTVDKIDAVVKGKFRITMDGESFILEPGDYVVINRNTEHSAAVVGNDAVVSIDAIKNN